MSEAFDRGHVVWSDGPFRDGDRPWLVVSSETHPFHGEEYLVVGITTTARDGAIELDEERWRLGGLPSTSYVSPWFLATIKHHSIARGVGAIEESTVDDILTACRRYLS